MTTHAAIHRLSALFLYLDQLRETVTRRVYVGNNPAIAAIYGPYRASVVLMFVITIIIIVFGTLIPVESAAIAKAHVVVLSNRKTIQHLEGGIVRQLLVKDGDRVKIGQALLELSDVASKASRSILQSQLYAEQATEARLIALRDGQPAITFSGDFLALTKSDVELKKMVDEQTALFTNQRQSYIDKVKTLKLKTEQIRDEIAGLKSQVSSAASQTNFIDDEIKTVREMVRKGLAPKPRLLSLQRERERLIGDKGQYTASIAKSSQAMNEIDVQLLNLANEFQTQTADDLKNTHGKVLDLQEKLRAASDVVTRTVITSPTEGIITGLKFHTEGGVIAPGTAILDIIPQNEQLVLEAKINPLDIDVVTSGLEARIIFSAYKSRNLPQLHGKVTKVSADSFTESQAMGDMSYYKAQITVDPKELTRVASTIKLYPGMPVEVYIKTGSRSFLGYLFAPLTDSLRKAFKES